MDHSFSETCDTSSSGEQSQLIEQLMEDNIKPIEELNKELTKNSDLLWLLTSGLAFGLGVGLGLGLMLGSLLDLKRTRWLIYLTKNDFPIQMQLKISISAYINMFSLYNTRNLQ